ncbi:hemerythrin domain-containing protein [Chondrinema litorale]|uniref:hemerythrin domain-containing protein n=1 Tax=Chondrinema litorale TaxID=2994555 RepID=UPI0025426E54|nr:hemerythrin domain-containing protein [Chondrinema litorale]UZR92847.1 hemerythrin domain-containing protein [Chondrinema litorale]
MRRHPKLTPVSRQHRKMLMLAQLLKKNAPAYKGLPTTPEGKVEYAIGIYVNLIEDHMEIEEKHIFPMAMKIDEQLEFLANELKEEHKVLKEKFLSLNPIDPNIELMNDLGERLEKHIRKEEREFFQQLQRVGKADLEALSLPIE